MFDHFFEEIQTRFDVFKRFPFLAVFIEIGTVRLFLVHKKVGLVSLINENENIIVEKKSSRQFSCASPARQDFFWVSLFHH